MAEDPNPYAPPNAELKPPPETPEHGPAWKAVLVGFLADTAITIVLAFILSIVYGGYLIASGTPPDEIGAAMGGPAIDTVFLVAILGAGGIGSLVGGYLCARIAKQGEYRLAMVLIAISLILGWLLSNEEDTAALVLMNTIVTVATILAGTALGARRNRQPR